MITKSIKDKMREYFFVHPAERLRVRQIERAVKVPLPSAIRYAKELEKEGILQSRDISGIRVFSADRNSKKFIIEKKLYNIKELFNSGLVDYIIKNYSNPAIIIFGSYSKGEDTEKSDIDMYIETPSKNIIELKKFEKVLSRNIQTFIYPDIKKIPNPSLANNILNGIVLNGFVEVLK